MVRYWCASGLQCCSDARKCGGHGRGCVGQERQSRPRAEIPSVCDSGVSMSFGVGGSLGSNWWRQRVCGALQK